MSASRVPLYRVQQVQEFDRLAIEEQGVDGYALMEQAGEAAFAALLSQWSQVRHLFMCNHGHCHLSFDSTPHHLASIRIQP